MLFVRINICSNQSKRVLYLCSQHLPKIFSQKMSSVPAGGFPNTIEGYGYRFNDAGQLRKIDKETGSITDQPFKFDVSDNAGYNQQHYEAIGETITEHVYQLLLDIGLHKIPIPSPETKESSFVFGTKPHFNDTKKLLILIHGSGVVRAGQWSRSLIINHSLDHGTQIPYIKRAISLGYDVLVTNTNHNYRDENGRHIALKGNESPSAHAYSVWNQLIAPAYDSIEHFAVVAHSYGGVVTLDLGKRFPKAFMEKCFAIGFTDSVHSAGSLPAELLKWFHETARNWVTSSKPLDTPLDQSPRNIPSYSAGHIKHEWTSWACIDALFAYLESRYTAVNAKRDEF